MTQAQERAIEVFKKRVIGFYGHEETKEFKKFEVEESTYGDVHIFCTVGEIGDEGTMAAVICRDAFSLFVGKKGGYKGIRPRSCKICSYPNVVEAIIHSRIK